ncbi:MAG TPA: fused MFS/spermidine synthase [Vicinamibacteria bacterium]|nr:fused MFS/spermidine synthase [Vicinamibacteria bacterium]
MIVFYAAATLLGSALLFVLEPMTAKRLLPLLGGTPAVWTTCLLFFQALLLAGYAYAHVATARLRPPWPVALHAALALVPLASLPLPATAPPPPQAQPSAWLLGTLLTGVGLPFFVLSASAPVLQSWFARAAPARDPYALYAASNLGSLLGLLAYPALLEPVLTQDELGRLWRLGYAAYAALVLVCARHVARAPAGGGPLRNDAASASAADAAVGPRTLARWIVLAAVPSSLVLGVTSYLATDVASVPLLWVVPLALYLLTLVAAFSRSSAAATAAADLALPMQALLVVMLMVGSLAVPLGLTALLHLVLFTAAALVCHGQLARVRPVPAHLTTYYLAIAVGGVLGGAFNALLAPRLFSGVVEYPLAIVAALALRPRGATRQASLPDRISLLALLAAALAAAAVWWTHRSGTEPRLVALLLAVPVLLAYALRRHPRHFAAAVGLMLLAGGLGASRYGPTVHAFRTFFGVYRVREDPATGLRVLLHGTTLHGMQSLDPAWRREPLGYYDRRGPVGQAFAALPAASRARVAVIGLGVGGLAAYARPGQRWTFFEIDPAVERLARDARWFSYLADCGERCAVVVGDGRVSLGREPAGAYDLLVLDAFSSDAIPVHLLTREAFLLYRSRLAGGGALLVHLSNRHLDLGPVLGRLADEQGLVALRQADRGDPATRPPRLSSDWMVLARDARDVGPLIVDSRWVPVAAAPAAPLWTDDHSSLLGVVRLRAPGR